jgi:hypothetical protein
MTEEISKLAKASLKKLIMARGSEEGFFYFVGNRTLTEAALRVTLKKKDKSGQVVFNQGKVARSEIKGSKFGRGEVTAVDKKLRFILTTGTASRDMMQKSLVQVLSKVKDCAYLRRAKVVLPGATEESDPTEKLTAADLAELDKGLDSEEMETLLNDAENISEMNDSLVAAFLSTQDGAAEFSEQFSEQVDEIDALLEADPLDDDTIQQKRRELAELVEFGEDLESGSFGLPLELLPVVNAAYAEIGLLLLRRIESAKAWLSKTDNRLAAMEVVEKVVENLKIHVDIVENSFIQLRKYTSNQMGV